MGKGWYGGGGFMGSFCGEGPVGAQTLEHCM